ncbi:hypothetical protein Hte_006418 [Hypoxylon texense]
MATPQTELEPKCSNCNNSSPTNPLLCPWCKQAQYCSKDCQKQDWRFHLTFCKHVSTNGASSSSLPSRIYYPKVALRDPKAKALARDIGLTLPGPHGYQNVNKSLSRLLRWLVLTGKDTPENLSLFFGRDEVIKRDHKTTRLGVLLRLDYMVVRAKVDENCPPWTPCEPSAEEIKEVEEIRAMQDLIRSLGARDVMAISPHGIRDILMKNLGDEWSTKDKYFRLAIRLMDQRYAAIHNTNLRT